MTFRTRSFIVMCVDMCLNPTVSPLPEVFPGPTPFPRLLCLKGDWTTWVPQALLMIPPNPPTLNLLRRLVVCPSYLSPLLSLLRPTYLHLPYPIHHLSNSPDLHTHPISPRPAHPSCV